jgi:hypothetical protein
MLTMPYAIGDRVIVNMRNLNPDWIPASPAAEVRGTVIENPTLGLYHVRLDDRIAGSDILMDLGEDRLMRLMPFIDV